MLINALVKTDYFECLTNFFTNKRSEILIVITPLNFKTLYIHMCVKFMCV